MTQTEFIDEVREFVSIYCNDYSLECDENNIVFTFPEDSDNSLDWTAEIEITFGHCGLNEVFHYTLRLDPNYNPPRLGINVYEDSYVDADAGGLFMCLFFDMESRYREVIDALDKTIRRIGPEHELYERLVYIKNRGRIA